MARVNKNEAIRIQRLGIDSSTETELSVYFTM